MKMSKEIAKIVVDKDDSLEELLLSLGYSKRAGTCAYPERKKTIVIIPVSYTHLTLPTN